MSVLTQFFLCNDKKISVLATKLRKTKAVAKKNVYLLKNEVTMVVILDYVELDHILSTRQLAFVSGVSRTSISKLYIFHPYRAKITEVLNKDDFG